MYNPLRIALARLVDVRQGEWGGAILSFLVLLLTSAAYTVLETARDALLVTYLPQRDFGVVYIAVAACALPAAGLLTRLGLHLDVRKVLLLTLALSSVAALTWYGFPLTRSSVVVFYVIVGVVSSAIFPQFWLLLGRLFTVGQSRRLFGPVASAGVFGSALGSATAAGLVSMYPIRALPLLSAALFAAAAGVAFSFAAPPPKPKSAEKRPVKVHASLEAFRAEPFLVRVAILVVLTTATALAIDYFFKWTIARSMPNADRGAFVARYYALINGAALVVQLFLGSALVRRLGVATALEVTPVIASVGGIAALVGGSAVLPPLILKGADASLRSSINRLTTELVYLPVSPAGRERAKPFVDGALVRIAQAVTAALFLGLASMHELTPRLFSAIVTFFALAWLGATFSIRGAYLAQLRQSVIPDDVRRPLRPEPLDLPGAELLVENLGSDDPLIVLASMNTLARRGHHRLIPALILRHPDEKVLERALEILGGNARTDWYTRGGQLLTHPNERVRLAAARALAMSGRLDAHKLDADSDPSVRGYATLFAALGAGSDADLVDDPGVQALLGVNDESHLTCLGVLAAIADAPPSGRVTTLLARLAAREPPIGQAAVTWTNLLARAAVRHHDVNMIPRLIALLAQRASRASIREALVALGEPALEAVARAFEDPTYDRLVRIHLPFTLARFGTKWAADKLLEGLERVEDGRVRYKALGALGRVVADANLKVDRLRVERSARATLAAYFQLLSLRVALGGPPPRGREQASKTYVLFAGLLDDKLRQALERVFRLLKIAHPKEDIHRVYLACLSDDRRARANASEFLDALLRRRDQEVLRELVRFVSDDLPGLEQVARASAVLGFTPPRSREDAIRAAVADPDIKLATLAALHAVSMGDAWVETALELRPALETTARDLFREAAPLSLRGSHA